MYTHWGNFLGQGNFFMQGGGGKEKHFKHACKSSEIRFTLCELSEKIPTHICAPEKEENALSKEGENFFPH